MVRQRIKYKISNWREYNKSLVDRGRITLWLSDDLEDTWYCKDKEQSGRRGHPKQYSDSAIELCLTLKYLYKLAYRATQGFLESLLLLTGFSLTSPCYSQMNRRSGKLSVKLKRICANKGSLDIVVDSTGLKVYGEGEWKVRQHGVSKRRTWRKLHLAVDPLDHEIVARRLTGNDKSDDQVFPDVLNDVAGEVENASGDGAYDKIGCYRACHERGTKLIAPPNKLAIPQKKDKIKPELIQRDAYVNRINSLAQKLKDKEKARKQWKQEVDYHTRSISETAMFRFKTICGDTLSSRLNETQQTEVNIKINILNHFTKLGMPNSYPYEIAA